MQTQVVILFLAAFSGLLTFAIAKRENPRSMFISNVLLSGVALALIAAFHFDFFGKLRQGINLIEIVLWTIPIALIPAVFSGEIIRFSRRWEVKPRMVGGYAFVSTYLLFNLHLFSLHLKGTS